MNVFHLRYNSSHILYVGVGISPNVGETWIIDINERPFSWTKLASSFALNYGRRASNVDMHWVCVFTPEKGKIDKSHARCIIHESRFRLGFCDLLIGLA